jgi:hypothetical protein
MTLWERKIDSLIHIPRQKVWDTKIAGICFKKQQATSVRVYLSSECFLAEQGLKIRNK